MAALILHHAVLAKEKDSDLPLRSATFLHPAPERDGSPTSQLFASAAYQDLIQRQPTHPDGPTSGWDLGLNLLGDPITTTEQKSLQDHQTKTKLRRLYAITLSLELLFGMWGTYATVRYCLAPADGLDDAERVCALVLGIASAFSVALVIISVLMPLVPLESRPPVWRYTRPLLRGCYLLLLSAGAMVNFVLVLIWHPDQLCHWDIDISWYNSGANTTISACPVASSVAWITAATLRLVVTLTLAFSFIIILRSYHAMRHPSSSWPSPQYSPYISSDPEDNSPVSASSPLYSSRSTYRLTQSEDSSRTFAQSITTLPKCNSVSTLAPSTSCTGHSRSHSTSSPKDNVPPRISPPASRRTSAHATNHGPETPLQMQPASTVIPPSGSRMLRRTSHFPVAQVTSDTVLPDYSPHSDDPRDPRSYASSGWKPVYRGTGAHLDVRKTGSTSENPYVRHAPQAGDCPEPFLSTHGQGEFVKEKDREDDLLVYYYGYGAPGATYPYLDTYNPQRPERYAESPSCEDVDARGLSQAHRGAIPGGPTLPRVPSESRSSLSMEDDEESSGEEEEYVAMMGGFVRRMATIESLGSKEAAGTLSTTGSVAPHSIRSKTPVSQFSSVRFVEHGSSGGSSLGIPVSKDGSHSTTYFSFSSGGTGTRVNEYGELLLGPNADTSTAGLPLPHRRR